MVLFFDVRSSIVRAGSWGGSLLLNEPAKDGMQVQLSYAK